MCRQFEKRELGNMEIVVPNKRKILFIDIPPSLSYSPQKKLLPISSGYLVNESIYDS